MQLGSQTTTIDIIDDFDGIPENAFLSNFSQHGASFEGVYYITSEHAYQAAKTLVQREREEIRNAPIPGIAKRLGQKVTMRPDWDEIKVGVMHQIVKSKFSSDIMRQKLFDTGNAILIEGNTWNDTFWGICDGVGENWLGRILMLVRSELRYDYRKYDSSI